MVYRRGHTTTDSSMVHFQAKQLPLGVKESDHHREAGYHNVRMHVESKLDYRAIKLLNSMKMCTLFPQLYQQCITRHE